MGWGKEQNQKAHQSKSAGKAGSGLKAGRNLYGKGKSRLEWAELDVSSIGNAVIAAISNGAAIMFAYSPNTGAASVRTFIGDDKFTGYAIDAEQFESLCRETIDEFGYGAATADNGSDPVKSD